MDYFDVSLVIIPIIAVFLTAYMARENYLKNPRPTTKHISYDNVTKKIGKMWSADKSNPLYMDFEGGKEYYQHTITVFNKGAKIGLIKAIDVDDNTSIKRFYIEIASGEQYYPIHEPSPCAIIPLYPKQSIAIFFVVSVDKNKSNLDYKINITFDNDFIKKDRHITNNSENKINTSLE